MAKNVRIDESFDPIAFITGENGESYNLLKLLEGNERIQTYEESEEEHYKQLKEDIGSADKRTVENAYTDLLVNMIHSINSVIKKYAMTQYTNAEIYDDLIVAGYEGAVEGLKKYEPEKGKPVQYMTYFIIEHVTGEFHKLTEKSDSGLTDLKKIRKVISEYEEHGIIDPTVMDVSIGTGFPENYIRTKMKEVARGTNLSIDDEAVQARPSELSVSPDKILSEMMDREALAKAIAELGDETMIDVIRMYYFEEMKLSDIAKSLDTPVKRVTRLINEALIKISKSKQFSDRNNDTRRREAYNDSVVLETGSAVDILDQIENNANLE